MKEIKEKLKSSSSASNTHTSLVQKCNESNVQGVLIPGNGEQVRNVQKFVLESHSPRY